ncbi:MAG: carboxypeptidase regulatory-like domain-containing protein [Patescibacteria group bacterium]|nr:carboxypeptidase regulatory-like domain-containing protein [Patescibacteria group bacterium]
MKDNKSKSGDAGFTLIEAVVGIAIFSLIAIGVYETFAQASHMVETSRLMVTAAALANEQFEIAHNMPYADIGLTAGLPSGKLSPTQNITRDNTDFLVQTIVQNIDDPFDGTIGGSPNDSSPADYKLVEIKISAPSNPRLAPLTFTEYIAPKNLENTTNNGALFVRVFDANGQPVSEANVHIANSQTSPIVGVNDTTNNDGILQIVDVPPSIQSYKITVSKNGYSQDRTYPVGSSTNPNPIMPDATVIAQQVTQTSFMIDRTATLNVSSVTETCAPVANIGFDLKGSKLIGSTPDIYKYQNSFDTGPSGTKVIDSLEWDAYNLTFNDSTHDLGGAISPVLFSLTPGSVQDVKIIAVPKNPRSLLVSVKQGGTTQPLSGATVQLTIGTSTKQLITGRGFLRQSDWSGGSGQENFTNPAAFYSSDGNIETADPAGEIKLKEAFGLYAAAGNLTSSTFDTGSASDFYRLEFLPLDQPPEAGTSSVLLQVAANNDNSTWNFLGPDGTNATFYSAANGNINPINNGNRYLRYKIYLATASSTYTPNVGEVSFAFTSLCVPPGQVLFDGLAEGDYTLNVSKSGFQPSEGTIHISDPSNQQEVILMPE